LWQHRLQAARDITEQSQFIVTDNERSLIFLVASQYIEVQVAESTIDLPRKI
jgi:outer membrane protein, heavy metal efflux system